MVQRMWTAQGSRVARGRLQAFASASDAESAASALHRFAKRLKAAAPSKRAPSAALLEAALTSLDAMSSQQLASTAWSVAILRETDVPLLAAISTAAVRQMAEFGPRELSNTAWAIATLQYRDGTLTEEIAIAATTRR